MIGAHPGGIRLTKRLLELTGINVQKPPAEAPDLDSNGWMEAFVPGSATAGNVLDLGAGMGESVRYLRALGYDAAGIDTQIRTDNRSADQTFVTQGDMRALTFPDGSYDLCLAECSIAVCGDGPAALREAYRVLRPKGSLLLSDVFFRKDSAPCLSMPGPLTFSLWEQESARAGFVIRKSRDETALWKEFFLESLWNGNAEDGFCSFFQEAGKSGCGYFLAWLQKRDA